MMDAKLLKTIGIINLFLFMALFIQTMYPYMLEMVVIFMLNAEMTFLLFLMFVLGLISIVTASFFSFYLRLNYTIFFESLGLTFIVPTMLLVVPFELLRPYLNYLLPYFIIPCLLICILIFLIVSEIVPHYRGEAEVRKFVLSFSTKHPDFKLNKLAMLCSVDKDFAKSVVNKMIDNKEIYAEYFNYSKKFAFNRRANLEEIDELMKKFKEWETGHISKKV